MTLRTSISTLSLTALLLLGGCGGDSTSPSATDPVSPDSAAEAPADEGMTSADPDGPTTDEETESVGAPPNQADGKPSEGNPATDDTAGAGAADTGAIAFDKTIVPGERVGPLTRDTSRQELAEQVGEARLVDTEIHVGEGMMEAGTEVDLGDGYSFNVIWADAERTTPREVRDLSGKWQTPEGISMGTSFEELQTILGPFELYGFAWDYGGTILLEDTQLSEYDGLLTLRVTPSNSSMQAANADYQEVMGDQVYSSTNPHLQPLDIEVYDMIVTLSAAE
ncbi:MAG: hypothetical protein VKK04_10310 [Synechococcales bacterium]|nr:hypothetical protein [Synechococcales bacterium]